MLTCENVLYLAEYRINDHLEILKGYSKEWNSDIEMKKHNYAMNYVIENYNHYSVTDSYHFKNEKSTLNFINLIFELEESILKINSLQS